MMYSTSVAPVNATFTRMNMLMQIMLCSLLIALCAQIRISLPFTPVPITLQTLSIMLVGGILGSRNGAIAVLVYLAQACAGLPVLSGHSDPLFLLSPVGGYLVGFVFQAYLVGWFVERSHAFGKQAIFFGCLCGSLVMFTCGVVWMTYYFGINKALLLGVIPFLPGEIIKFIIASAFFKRYV